jgi:hypothetical protein
MTKCPTDNSERLFELKMTPQLGPGNNPTCCLNGLVCAGGVRSVPPHHLVKEESLVRQKYDRCNETNNFYTTPTVKANVSKPWTSWNEKK